MKQLSQQQDQSRSPSSKSSFLAAARTQLDADHFRWEKIKKRLIEYLVVVRLKELNADHEIAEQKRRAESVALEEAVRVNAEAETKSVTGGVL